MTEPTPAVTPKVRSQMEKEAEELLRSEGITPASAIPAQKSGCLGSGDYEVDTNIHGIKLNNSEVWVHRYDVTVSGIMRGRDGVEKVIDLTKRQSGDAMLVDRRERCREIFVAFVLANRDFVKNPAAIYYDLQSILFSLDPLDVPASGRKFAVPVKSLSESLAFYVGCTVEIRAVIGVNKKFQLGDLANCITEDLDLSDHSLLQFLDLATSQHLLFAPDKYVSLSATKNFLLEPAVSGFHPNDVAFFEENGGYLAIGCEKSVRVMEGVQKRGGSMAVVVESKKTPFHCVESLMDKIKRLVPNIRTLHNGDIAKIEKFCTGLCVETRHLSRPQRFYIKGLDYESAATRIVNIDGTDMSVQQYFQQRYNIALTEPNIPLLRIRGVNQTCYMPIELCHVVDNQRIKTHQQTPRQVQETIKKCAIAPTALRHQNDLIFNSQQFNTSEHLKYAGIVINERTIAVKGAILPPPEIEYSGRHISTMKSNFSWQNQAFLIPQTCTMWVAYAFLGVRDRLQENDFNGFINRYIVEAKNRGIRITDPTDVKLINSCNVKDLSHHLATAAKHNCTFALIIHSDNADEMHSHLKYCERQYEIVTQAIRFGTLRNILTSGQPLTVQNIVNKTNIKLGGLNYTLNLTSPGARETLNSNSLYIGIGMNHPGDCRLSDTAEEAAAGAGREDRKPPPSVVGYCANIGITDNFEFIGDFCFQQPQRDEKTEVIRTIVTRCVKAYRSNRRAEPKQIVLYRNGCSEGNFSMILRLEVPLIKTALAAIDCEAKLVVLVLNKIQSVRFVPRMADERSRPPEQNVQPGFLIDHSIVHPTVPEFYLNSHRALQGTARTPKYSLLLNESDFDVATIERITFALCFGHQIVALPTSLPSPVYIALRYAERGRKLYNVWLSSSESDHGKLSYDEASERLSYYTNPNLSTRRVNA